MSDDHVNPGDLITAELWNRIVDKVQLVEERLDKMVSEGGLGQIMITSTSPADNIREGDTLIILGLNFGLATEAIEVRIGGVVLNNTEINWMQSNDQKLVVTVPPLGLTPGGSGASMVITVRNRRSSDSATRRFLPAPVVVSGDVFVDYRQADALTVPGPGGTLRIPFRVISAANVQAQFDLHASVVGLSTTARVVNSTTDSTDLPRVPLAPNATADCAVEVPIPSGAANVRFAVSLRAVSGNVHGTTGLLPFQVGATLPAPSTGESLLFMHGVPSGAATFDVDTASASIPVGGANGITFHFRCVFASVGDYTYRVNFFGPNMADMLAGWNSLGADPLVPGGANSTDDFSFAIAPSASAAGSSGYMELKVTGPGLTGPTQIRWFSIQCPA